MIAKNEEKVIGRAIDSCKDVIDEIILVDTGSEDHTVEIAKQKGAKVYFFAWKNDFAAAKNYALSKAKGDWIVFLDADEYFGNDTGKNLRVLLAAIEPSVNAVACKMYNIDSNSGKLLDVLTHTRIFRNSKYIKYVNPIHEMLQDSRRGKKIHAFFVFETDLILFHTGYSSKDQAIKAKRNLAMLLHEVEAGAQNPVYYHYIADCYVGLGDWEKVIEYTRRFWEGNVQFAVYNTRPHQNVIDAMLQLNYPLKEVMQEINRAIEKYPTHPQFYFSKGTVLFDLRRYDEALAYLKKSLELNESYNELEINGLSVNLWKIDNVLAAIYEHKAEYDQAISLYIKSLQDKWDNKPCCDRLLVLLRESSFSEVITVLDSIYNMENEIEVEFLLERLVNHAIPKVLAHYVIQRQKRFPKDDFILLQMLVANGYYDKALAALLECCKQDKDERLLIVSAAASLLSENSFWVNEFLRLLPERLVNVMNAYLGEEVQLSDEYLVFVELLHVFILWGNKEQLTRMISLRSKFDEAINLYIAKEFVDKGMYDLGGDFYNEVIKFAGKNGLEIDSEWHFSYGYCLHRLGIFNEAVDELIEAYKVGYRKKDVFELLRWDQLKINFNSKVNESINEILKNEIGNQFV